MKKIMQRRWLLTLVLLFSLSIINTYAQRRGRNNSRRTVYYVVCASFSSLSEAKKASDHGSQFDFNLHVGPIYQATANGKTVYRMCEGCYYSRQAAQNFVDMYGGWIWATNGLAKCVYLGRYDNYDDTSSALYVRMKPLTPR